MEYRDAGLDAEQLEALKGAWRKTAWRLKILKPDGARLPDAAAMETVKIDTDYEYYNNYSLDTDGGRYAKMAHDAKRNRTFVLHREKLGDEEAVVSIINHSIGPDNPGYIEKINRDTAIDWPTELIGQSVYAWDMDYNPDRDELAVGTNGIGTALEPSLLVINTAKYDGSLRGNLCNELADNPDYLKVTRLHAPANVVGYQGGYVKFVRYYRGAWWTWTRCRVCDAGPDTNYFWQLGRFGAAGGYSFFAQYGFAPRYSTNYGTGEPFSESVCFPAQPRCEKLQDDNATPGSSVFCDPVNALDNVTAFEIEDIGESGCLLLGTTPSRSEENGFGTEACVFRVDIATMLDELEKISDPQQQPDSRYSTSVALDSNYNDTTGMHEAALGTIETSAPGYTGYVCIKAIQQHEGAAAESNVNYYLLAQTASGGTVRQFALAPGSNEQTVGYTTVFAGDGEDIRIGIAHAGVSESESFRLKWNIEVFPLLFGIRECIGVHSSPAIAAEDDNDRMTVSGREYYEATWQCAEYNYVGGSWTSVTACRYDGESGVYTMAMTDYHGEGLGLWTHDGTSLKRYRNIGYEGADYIGALANAGGGYVVMSACSDEYNDVTAVFFNPSLGEFAETVYTAQTINRGRATGVMYDSGRSRVGVCSGCTGASYGEIQFMSPGECDRDVRVWWDGSNPDVIMGCGAGEADSFGQRASFFEPVWSQSKGRSSYSFSFSVRGPDYLPGTRSAFNENDDFSGSYSAALGDASRVIVERGVWIEPGWEWIQEGQVFVLQTPASLSGGESAMQVTCMGPISLLVTRATYDGFHRPESTVYSNVALESDDDLAFRRLDPETGSCVTDWKLSPLPVVCRNGQTVTDYTLNAASGTVLFNDPQMGEAITASFQAYEPGTNEAEDIIICILTYPQELGGCGLDESYITRTVSGAVLTTEDGFTYAFPKNKIRLDDPKNKIYRNGSEVTQGFEWNEREGTVTFDVSQTGFEITGDCVYYTIQRSGVTLKPINLTPREQKSSYDAIQEVCRRVAPNYIFREGRDGKLECDYFTMKQPGDADVTILDGDVILTSIGCDPAYEGVATRVLSLGYAEEQELPDHCCGREVIDDWSAEAVSRPQQ